MWHTLALVPLMLAQVPNEAETLFRRMETKLAKARTLACTFETKAEGAKAFGLKGSLYLEEGNKVRLEAEVQGDNKSQKMLALSDGVKRITVSDQKARKPEDVPATFSKDLVSIFSRGGVFVGLFMPSRVVVSGDGQKPKPRDLELGVADFKLGARENVGNQEAQVIEYQLKPNPDDPKTRSTRVWLDIKTSLPLKRVLVIEDGDQKVTITEIYSELTLDQKIDPKRFELPRE